MWFKKGFGYCGPDAREAVKEAFNVVREVLGDNEVEHSLPVDVINEENGYLVRVSLPGFKREEVSVELRDGVLSISGTRNEEGTAEAKYLVRERAQGSFARRVKLREASEEGIKAELRDGVLAVRVPRATPQAKAVTIE